MCSNYYLCQPQSRSYTFMMQLACLQHIVNYEYSLRYENGMKFQLHPCIFFSDNASVDVETNKVSKYSPNDRPPFREYKRSTIDSMSPISLSNAISIFPHIPKLIATHSEICRVQVSELMVILVAFPNMLKRENIHQFSGLKFTELYFKAPFPLKLNLLCVLVKRTCIVKEMLTEVRTTLRSKCQVSFQKYLLSTCESNTCEQKRKNAEKTFFCFFFFFLLNVVLLWCCSRTRLFTTTSYNTLTSSGSWSLLTIILQRPMLT